MAIMAIEKTRALVIRATPFGETSSVVSLYCREFGKLRALAKGAWRPKSGFDGGLDLLSISQVLVLRKSSGGLDLLTEASLESRFRVGTSLAAVLGGLRVAELLDALTADGDPQPELFEVAHATVRRLSGWDQDEAVIPTLIAGFELALLSLCGHAPVLDHCVECHGSLPQRSRTAFGMLDGGTLCDLCRRHRRGVVSVSAAALAAMRTLSRRDVDEGSGIPGNVAGEIRGIMNTSIAHLLGRPLRVPATLARGIRRQRRP
ncbi:MAG: DNA repair protein RecO [Planctomycetes bacterium]|nr:DNA repair protein RecO [Planctomycetota bacterium]